MSYSVLGGFGIAIYRILLIKYDILIKEKVGEKRLLGIILFFQTLVISVCLGVQNNIGRTTIRPKCMGLPYGHVLDILDMYRISLGDDSVIVFQTSLHMFMASMFLFITIAELIIYIIFFHHLYKHDNNERLRLVLDAEIINRRNTRNAVSFFAHFCSFVAEILFTVGFMIAIKKAKNDHKSSLKRDAYVIARQLRVNVVLGPIVELFLITKVTMPNQLCHRAVEVFIALVVVV